MIFLLLIFSFGNFNFYACISNNQLNHYLFRMQDRDAEPDEDICVKVNLYLSDSSEAASAAGISSTSGSTAAPSDGADTNGMNNDELLRIMQGALGSEGGRAITGA